MRILISDSLRRSGKVDLIGIAKNGQEGVDLVNRLSPDVVLTDMVMPQYDGLYLVKEVMKNHPVPIVVLSALDKMNPQIFEALNEGAVDFLEKDIKKEADSDFDALLIDKLTVASKASFGALPRKRINEQHTFNENLRYDILAIGASTGGPGAIESLLTNLPSNFNLPIVIAQHMPHKFIDSYAKRLNELCGFEVKVAQAGEEVRSGKVYFASGQTNTQVVKEASGKLIFAFTEKQYTEFNHPSVDCLFESLALATGKKTLSVLLTGMGKDGVMGLGKIHAKGGFSVAQDENSCVVYGMPKFAVEKKVVNRVVSLKDMPAFIVSCCDL